jgi:hypothetical protein
MVGTKIPVQILGKTRHSPVHLEQCFDLLLLPRLPSLLLPSHLLAR